MSRKSVSVLVPRDDRVLVVSRPHGRGFCPPGGKLDPCEQPVDAAVRELLEETGIVSDPSQLRHFYGAVYPAHDCFVWVFRLIPVYFGEPVSPEGLACRWMPWDRVCGDVFGDFYSQIPLPLLVSQGVLRSAVAMVG